MRTRGTDGLMLARNRVLAEVRRHGGVTPEICDLTNWIICGDEGLTVDALFPPEVAAELTGACTLVCHLPRTRDPQR